jgi:16S rRNA (guanine527-N7)-methyltransferase
MMRRGQDRGWTHDYGLLNNGSAFEGGYDWRVPEAARNLPPPEFMTQVASLGIEFEPGDVDQLQRYLDLLLDANTRFNLTAITDQREAWMRHVFDSLTLAPLIASSGGSRVIDVGSGGGLPGIPLAIALRGIHFTLLEATGKKARFLSDVVTKLGLGNVEVINDRAETIGQVHRRHVESRGAGGAKGGGGHREQYDVVIARAVGKLPVLLELTVPLAKVGGHVLAMKGEKAAKEIEESKAALHLLHCHVVDTVQTTTGVIVIIHKQRKTPRMYPRRAGEPKRAPLGLPREGQK